MEITTLTNGLTSLALLYGWVLFAAVIFAFGEHIYRRVFGRQPGRGGASDQAKG